MRRFPAVSWSAAAGLTLWLAATMSIVLAASLSGQPPGDSAAGAGGAEPDWEILERHPGEGEQCLVCSQAIDGEMALVIRYKGRIFHVKESMLDELRRDPDGYFRKLQARSGLFDEEAIGAEPPRTGWLAAGVYVVIGLVCGAVCAGMALARSRRTLPWFFAGLFGNVLAVVAVAVAGPAGDGARVLPSGLAKIPSTRAPVPCPGCGAENHPAAEACTSCGASLVPAVAPEGGLREGRAW